MRSWGSTTSSGERVAMIAAAVVLLLAAGLGVWMGTGAAAQRALIDDPRPPTTAEGAYTPRPQSGPVVEIVPASLGQPDPAAATAAAVDAGVADAGVVDARVEPELPSAPAADGGAGASSPAARVEAALALVAYDWRNLLPGWTIEISGGRSGLMGLTRTAERQIEIYVRPSMSTDALAHVVAHEIGHAVDLTHLDAEERGAFQMLRGRAASSRWWAADGASDFATGAGDWAESFAFMVTGGKGRWGSDLGPPPGLAQQAAMRELMK
jgi:hypothetical protein